MTDTTQQNQEVQQQAQPTQQQQIDPGKEINIVLTVAEVDGVVRSLAEQPFKVVAPLIEKILNQANSQV